MLLVKPLSRFLPMAAMSLSLFTTYIGAQELNAEVENHHPRIACDADNGGLTLPPGFCALVVADNVGLARHLVVTPTGNIYVALNPARDGSDAGGLLALRDRDGDGRADERQMFFDRGGNGVAYRFGQLFFGTNDSVLRFPLRPWEFLPTEKPTEVVTGLPNEGDHVSKTLVVTPLGNLLVNIGSASNACQVENRVPGSPGVDPCPELTERAGIWRFAAWRSGQTQADGRRFATGLRNAVALAVNPSDRALYAVQNGRDQLAELWPALFTPAQDAVLPSEELLRVRPGRDYGWPYCYHDPVAHNMLLAPEYGGDGETEGRCADVEEPNFAFPAHWAPLSMLFYTGGQFPDRYRSGVFVAFHGSRFDPLNQPAGPGYNVVFLPLRHGQPASAYQVFADGFIGPQAATLPDDAQHRPVGLAQGPDGSLYISDDKGGRIYRILYRGAQH